MAGTGSPDAQAGRPLSSLGYNIDTSWNLTGTCIFKYGEIKLGSWAFCQLCVAKYHVKILKFNGRKRLYVLLQSRILNILKTFLSPFFIVEQSKLLLTIYDWCIIASRHSDLLNL